MSKFYKEITTDRLSLIQKEVVEYLNLKYITAIHLDINPEDILSKCPQLKLFLTSINVLHCIALIRTVVLLAHDRLAPHTDGGAENPRCLALNIPLLHCENSLTTFYKKKNPFKKGKEAHNAKLNYSYTSFDDDSVKAVESLVLTHPTLLRVNEIHSVENNSDRIRYCLTIRFAPEPLELFNIG